jgi:phosphatidylinositol-3-phosphatase
MASRRAGLVAPLLVLILAACVASPPTQAPAVTGTAAVPSTPTAVPSETATATPAPPALVPAFEHIVIVVLENKEFGVIYGSAKMPYFNQLVRSYTLLTQHYAVAHPSLPNYLALIGGDTFGITFDCTSCFVDAQTLPDQIEASGRTWKTYQEDMPSACFPGPEAGDYAIKHNPFVYFKPIRLDAARCARSVVPFTQLAPDLAAGALPNFSFITPNLCNDAHDCDIRVADDWLKGLMVKLLPALDADGQPYLVIITWDEGQGDHSCCGLPRSAGGRVATLLVSPQAKAAFLDDTPYTHYSILKTIEEAWGLEFLGRAADAENVLIVAPWK